MPKRRIGGAGNDLIDDDFNDGNLDGWSVNGTVVAANQRVECTVTLGGGDDEITQGIVPLDEIWCDYDLRIPSGLTFPNPSLMSLGTLFAGGTQIIRLAIIELGTGIKWRTEFWEGGITANNTNIDFSLDTDYIITLHYKLESGPGNLDGIAEIWACEPATDVVTKILDIQNHNNDTVQPNACHIGNTSGGSSVAGSVYDDNVKVGTIGLAPFYAQIDELIDFTDLTELVTVLG